MTSAGGRATIVLAAVSFGALAFFAELALRADVEPMTFLLGRFATATAILALVRSRSRQPANSRAAGGALLLGLVVYAGQAICLTFALERADVAPVAVLFGTYPVFVLALLLPTAGRHLGSAILAPLGGVLTGSVLVLSPGEGRVDTAGVALALGAAALFAVFVIGSNTLVATLSATTVAMTCCLGAVLSLLVAGSVTGRLHTGFDPDGWLWMVAAGVVSTGVAFVALFRSLPLVGPAVAGVVLGAEPVVTVALALVFLGDDLSAYQAVGVLVLVGSVVLVQRSAALPPPRAGA